MGPENPPTGGELIDSVLRPHVKLAADLLRMVNSTNTGDPTYRFEVAALIVFLSGVEKALNLLFELMYLAHRIEWKWLAARRRVQPGFIECHQSWGAKLEKLRSLGLDLEELKWLGGLRNDYVHACSIYAGYRAAIDDRDDRDRSPRVILRASGPEVSFFDPPLVPLGPDEIQRYALELSAQVGQFLDGAEWQGAWSSLAEQLRRLPINPEPEYSSIAVGSPDDDIGSLIDGLNERYVGVGLARLTHSPA